MSFCTNCGTEVAEGIKFCPNCGNAVGTALASQLQPIVAPATEDKKPKKEKKKKKKLLPVIIIIAIVVILIALFSGNNSEEPITYSEANYGGIIFQIPSNYTLTDDGSEIAEYRTAKNDASLMIKVSGDSVEEDIFYNNIEKIDENYTGQLSQIMDDSVLESSRTATVADMPCREYTFTGKADGIDVAMNACLIDYTTGNKEIMVITLCKLSQKDTVTGVYQTLLATAKSDGIVVPKKSQATATTPLANAEGVDPDLKAYLDSYEAFVDEYVEFMKKYMADPTNVINMLNEYTDIMTRYEDFEKKINAYDSDSMSTADAAYYLEVTTRCTQKMLEIYQ